MNIVNQVSTVNTVNMVIKLGDVWVQFTASVFTMKGMKARET